MNLKCLEIHIVKFRKQSFNIFKAVTMYLNETHTKKPNFTGLIAFTKTKYIKQPAWYLSWHHLREIRVWLLLACAKSEYISGSTKSGQTAFGSLWQPYFFTRVYECFMLAFASFWTCDFMFLLQKYLPMIELADWKELSEALRGLTNETFMQKYKTGSWFKLR
jgi:hypothetical protein